MKFKISFNKDFYQHILFYEELYMRFLVIILVLFCSAQIQAVNCQDEIPDFSENKIYLSQKQIEIIDGAILVTINGHLSITRQLSCDENGLYTLARDVTPSIDDK